MSVIDVQRYYDINTPAFEKYGQSRHAGVIRRAVWGPDVTSRSEAFLYVDRQIAMELQALQTKFPAPLRVLDFGSGLAASLLFLASVAEIESVGVTISHVQAQRARVRIAAAGMQDRVSCLAADFLTLPDDVAPAQLVMSIEAFLHSPSPTAYFTAAARHTVPGGTLVVCDDFLTSRATGPLRKRERHWIAELRHGWVAPSIVTIAEVNAAADQAGFEPEKNVDLTPYLELRRPRDRLLSVAVLLAGRLPIPGYRWRSLVGGDALQMALTSGLIEHRYLSWRRRA
jgi:cyclopropane fatty-acyl-phospholipid synthase-like methyltransferase